KVWFGWNFGDALAGDGATEGGEPGEDDGRGDHAALGNLDVPAIHGDFHWRPGRYGSAGISEARPMVTRRRKAVSRAMTTAAETMAPSGMSTGWPFTVTFIGAPEGTVRLEFRRRGP